MQVSAAKRDTRAMAAPGLEVRVADRGAFGVTLRLEGELDIATCDRLREALSIQAERPLITITCGDSSSWTRQASSA